MISSSKYITKTSFCIYNVAMWFCSNYDLDSCIKRFYPNGLYPLDNLLIYHCLLFFSLVRGMRWWFNATLYFFARHCLADSCSVDLNGKIHLWFFLIITLGFGVIIHMNISGWKRCISSFDYWALEFANVQRPIFCTVNACLSGCHYVHISLCSVFIDTLDYMGLWSCFNNG